MYVVLIVGRMVSHNQSRSEESQGGTCHTTQHPARQKLFGRVMFENWMAILRNRIRKNRVCRLKYKLRATDFNDPLNSLFEFKKPSNRRAHKRILPG